MIMNDINMERTPGPSFAHSRRTILRAAAAGIGVVVVPKNLRAAISAAMTVNACAFDGESLLVAGQNLSRSNDGGALWETLSMPGGGAILALATHPNRPGRILAGLASGGVSLSEDGGRTWREAALGLPRGAVTAIVASAAQSDTVYAAVRGDGVWKNQNAGESWTFVMDRPWLEEAERDLLTLASVNLASGMGGIWIYAGTETGLTRVPDCFCRWQDVQPEDAMDALVTGDAPSLEAPLPAGETIQSLISAPSAPETLYAALPSGIWSSRDAGLVWSRLTPEGATAVAVHPVNPNHIVAAGDSGLTRSRDGGANWSALAAI